MKTNLMNVKHYLNCQPGGWKCHCCGPAPSHRKTFARIHKRKMYRMLDKYENEANLNQ